MKSEKDSVQLKKESEEYVDTMCEYFIQKVLPYKKQSDFNTILKRFLIMIHINGQYCGIKEALNLINKN